MAASRQTPLYLRHEELGAKFVEFGGWLMPVSYQGILEEHRDVRTSAGIFDLCHMGEITVAGDRALEVIQEAMTNDASTLAEGKAQYSLLCRPDGGILDDIIVYRRKEDFLLVVNAANREKDWAWLKEQNRGRAELADVSDEMGLIAVQGPKAEEICSALTDEVLEDLGYFTHTEGEVAGVPCLISRTGYTGEDGLEIYMPVQYAGKVWDALLEAGGDDLQPVGLGARDTLRLEAGYTLYGNDIDEATNPLEAGLGWVVAWDKGDFIGKEALAAVKEKGVSRRLVGFEMLERGIPRHGYPIQTEQGEVGIVTSGTMSPTLGKAIGMGYVQRDLAQVGTELEILIRRKPGKARIVKRPFIKPSVKR